MDGWKNRYGSENENPNTLAGFAHRLFGSINSLNYFEFKGIIFVLLHLIPYLDT